MTLELAFVLAMPAFCTMLIIWMIASGYTNTGAIASEDRNPYPVRLDKFGRWVVVIITVVAYVVIAAAFDPLTAATVFAALIMLDVVGALLWTIGQQLFGAPAVPFGTRLFRNIRDFYIRIVGGILQGV